jgi:hypothetical protein
MRTNVRQCLVLCAITACVMTFPDPPFAVIHSKSFRSDLYVLRAQDLLLALLALGIIWSAVILRYIYVMLPKFIPLCKI